MDPEKKTKSSEKHYATLTGSHWLEIIRYKTNIPTTTYVET